MRKLWSRVVAVLLFAHLYAMSSTVVAEHFRLGDPPDGICEAQPSGKLERAFCKSYGADPRSTVMFNHFHDQVETVFIVYTSREDDGGRESFGISTFRLVCMSAKGIVRTCTKEKIEHGEEMGVTDEVVVLNQSFVKTSKLIMLRMECIPFDYSREKYGRLGLGYDISLVYSTRTRRWQIGRNEFVEGKLQCRNRQSPWGF